MKILKILGNLNNAIGILLLIAFFSIFGTILEQNQLQEFYKINYPDNGNFINWKLIQLFNLDHIYSTCPPRIGYIGGAVDGARAGSRKLGHICRLTVMGRCARVWVWP